LAVRETPRVDIGPTWQEQDGLLRDLWLQNQKPEAIAEQLGRSVAAIMTRAARLGLPRRTAPGRKPGRRMLDQDQRQINTETRIQTRAAPRPQENLQVTPQTSLRICLMCLNKFESMGKHNRICSSCKGSSEYETACSLAEIHLPSS
jgi:hypothetical protein